MNKIERKPEPRPAGSNPGDLLVSNSSDDMFLLDNRGDYVRLADGYRIEKAAFIGLLEPFNGVVVITTGVTP